MTANAAASTSDGGPIGRLLVEHGIATRRIGAMGVSQSPVLEGWQLVRFDAELVYRLVSATNVLIVRYRRSGQTPGLRNPFRCFEWFHSLLRDHRHETGVTFSFGVIDTSLFRGDGGIDDATLTRIYRDLMGGSIIGTDDVPGLSPFERAFHRRSNTRWVCQQLESYTTAREYRRRRNSVTISAP